MPTHFHVVCGAEMSFEVRAAPLERNTLGFRANWCVLGVIAMLNEVPPASFEVHQPARKPRRLWVCAIPSLYIYRLAHLPGQPTPFKDRNTQNNPAVRALCSTSNDIFMSRPALFPGKKVH